MNWADWSVNTWCPILGPVPDVEGMTEGDPAGQAATLIHHLRRDFFDVDMVTTDSVQVANAPRNPDEYDHGHDWIAQARVIHREAAAIEQHAVWALDIWRKTRSGGQEPLRLADAFKECSDGRQGASVDTLERLLTTAVNRALEFQVGFAAARGAPPPFKIEAWPIHNVLALLAIHAAADCIHDFLADYRDQTEVRRYRALGNAQTLDRLARDYKASADAKAEPSKRGSKTRGVPRPGAHSPLRVTLTTLVEKGLSNDKILETLSSEEATFDDQSLAIVTFDAVESIKADGILRWYPRGYPDKETSTPIKTIRNLLTEVRKGRNPG